VATGHRAAAVRRCQHRGGVDWLRRGRSWYCPGRATDSFSPDFGRDGRPPDTRDANPHSQTRKGVSVEVNRGKRTLVQGAFLAMMRSGHVGIFRRRGKARLPIEELLGPWPSTPCSTRARPMRSPGAVVSRSP
jgi:hypothetical protein